MDINEILKYEEKRRSMKIKIKNLENISIDELLILNLFRKYENKNLDLRVIKAQMIKMKINLNRPLNSLFYKGYFMKKRHNNDERKVEIINIDYKRIDKVLKTWEDLVTNL